MGYWLRYRTEELEFVGPVPPVGRRDVFLLVVLLALALLEFGYRLDRYGIAAGFVALAPIAALLGAGHTDLLSSSPRRHRRSC